jgi:hypothetical protein
MFIGRVGLRIGTTFGARANCFNVTEQDVVLLVAACARANSANMNSQRWCDMDIKKSSSRR